MLEPKVQQQTTLQDALATRESWQKWLVPSWRRRLATIG